MTLAAKKIAITGANGMLAGDLIPVVQESGAHLSLMDLKGDEAYGLPIGQLDITSFHDVREVLRELEPEWVINCAAYTQVDRAEHSQQASFAVNGNGAGNLARAAKEIGAKLLHISTDYVFGGSEGKETLDRPWSPDDEPRPCGVYGKSKRYGEELVMRALPENSTIVRTSWLHGAHGPNFVHTMLRLGKEKDELKIVSDQIGSPTWTGWLAQVIKGLVEKDSRGIFHATCKGNISWMDFAKEIFAQSNIDVKVEPQSTEELDRPAPRPRFSTLDLSKLEAELGQESMDWKEGLRNHLGVISTK